MKLAKVWPVALVVGALFLSADPALAQEYLPPDWQQPMDFGGNAVVRAIFAIARFVIPILGVIVLLHGMIALMSAVHDAFRGRQPQAGALIGTGTVTPVMARILEVMVGIFLVAIPLTGMWVPLTEGLLTLAQRVVDSVSAVLRGAGGP